MSIFERYLTLWVALAMVVGITIGAMIPGLVAAVVRSLDHQQPPPHPSVAEPSAKDTI